MDHLNGVLYCTYIQCTMYMYGKIWNIKMVYSECTELKMSEWYKLEHKNGLQSFSEFGTI